MVRRNARKRSRRRSRRRAKRRQQKLSVNTVEKIAKRAASKVLQKKSEVYSHTINVSTPFDEDGDIKGNIVTVKGMWDADPTDPTGQPPDMNPLLTSMNLLLWGPQTHYIKTISNVQGEFANQEDGERQGRSIFFSGIQFRGGFILPKNCFQGDITMLVVKTKIAAAEYVPVDVAFNSPNDPWALVKDNEYRRHYSVVYRRTFRMFQKTGEDGLHSKVVRMKNIWVPIGKKILYHEIPVSAHECNKEDFTGNYYQVFFQSNKQHWQDEPDEDGLKGFPQVFGQLRFQYRDL